MVHYTIIDEIELEPAQKFCHLWR